MKEPMFHTRNLKFLLVIFVLFLAGGIYFSKTQEPEEPHIGARTEGQWQNEAGGYIKQNDELDVLIEGTNKYLNFGTLSGSSGYGFRDNSGTMEVKDSGGSWTAFSALGGGAAFAWPPTTWQGVQTNATSSRLLVNADFSVVGTSTIQGTLDIGNGTVTTTLNEYAGRKTVELILYRPLDFITSSTNKILSFMIPESLNGMNLVTSTAYVDSVATSDGDTTSTTIDIYNETDGTSMLTNLLGIPHGSRFSRSASSSLAFQINTGADDVATYDEISVYIKQTSGGTAPKGLVVTASFELP